MAINQSKWFDDEEEDEGEDKSNPFSKLKKGDVQSMAGDELDQGPTGMERAAGAVETGMDWGKKAALVGTALAPLTGGLAPVVIGGAGLTAGLVKGAMDAGKKKPAKQGEGLAGAEDDLESIFKAVQSMPVDIG